MTSKKERGCGEGGAKVMMQARGHRHRRSALWRETIDGRLLPRYAGQDVDPTPTVTRTTRSLAQPGVT